ncbi:MAG: CotH kinase family protein [Acidimicrobiales bacterium]|nr:CotH kinase family protein [Acidimicrobiales bacterium]
MLHSLKTPTGARRLRVVLATAALSVAMTACGAARGSTGSTSGGAVPTSTAESTAASPAASPSTSTADPAVGIGLFDATTVHDLSIAYDEAAYAELVAAYRADGEKVWIEATVTIDGATYERAGLRLKGNSSLFSLNDVAGGSEAQTLPWLVRLDKYVDGQAHEGVTDFVIRSNSSETALNEAVALELLEAAGLASEDSAVIRLTMNGSEAELRLIVEHLDETWEAERFSTDGQLYKAESDGDYSYRGDDPAAYEDVFDQETGFDPETGDDDLTPLIEFLEFINTSDDAVFAAGLDEHLDVQAFATYLAFEELIDNFDDIDGPGNNSYLRYDATTGTMTVVAWDHNLAFGVRNVGGGGGPGGAMPNGLQPPTDGQRPEARPAMGGGGPAGRSNVLVDRFLAIEEYARLVEEARGELQATLFDSGLADELLAERAAVLIDDAGDLVDSATVQAEAAAITASIEA